MGGCESETSKGEMIMTWEKASTAVLISTILTIFVLVWTIGQQEHTIYTLEAALIEAQEENIKDLDGYKACLVKLIEMNIPEEERQDYIALHPNRNPKEAEEEK
jgi:hypothetical protein